jgi:hypothetical protein
MQSLALVNRIACNLHAMFHVGRLPRRPKGGCRIGDHQRSRGERAEQRSVKRLARAFSAKEPRVVDRAIEFVKTVGKTIFELGELLLTILTRMAHLLWSIIKHPIRFFETLVSGLMQGIWRFIENIGTYLQEAFWNWITGATSVTSAPAGASRNTLAIPKSAK